MPGICQAEHCSVSSLPCALLCLLLRRVHPLDVVCHMYSVPCTALAPHLSSLVVCYSEGDSVRLPSVGLVSASRSSDVVTTDCEGAA